MFLPVIVWSRAGVRDNNNEQLPSYITSPLSQVYSRLRSNSAVSWVFMKGNLARVVASLCGYYRQEVGLMVHTSRLPDLNQLARLGEEEEVESLIRLVLGVAVTCPDRARHISIILSQSTQVILTFITFASVICQKM